MIKYDHFVNEDAQGVTETLEKCHITPEQIISVTSKVRNADTYKYEYSGSMDINVNTYYVVFYWYEE